MVEDNEHLAPDADFKIDPPPQAQNRQDEGGHPKARGVEVRHTLARHTSPVAAGRRRRGPEANPVLL